MPYSSASLRRSRARTSSAATSTPLFAERSGECGEPYAGNAYVDTTLPRLPASLRDATDQFEQSALARAAFGEAVVEFYVRHARLEHQAFSDAVTDWERQRYFEQI